MRKLVITPNLKAIESFKNQHPKRTIFLFTCIAIGFVVMSAFAPNPLGAIISVVEFACGILVGWLGCVVEIIEDIEKEMNEK